MKQQDLIDTFFSGGQHGTASNMAIATVHSGDRALVGYCHAVYAFYPHDGRFEPVIFTGWKGASKSTTQHMGMMPTDDYECLGGRPGLGDIVGEPTLKRLRAIEGDDKDYGGFHQRQEEGYV